MKALTLLQAIANEGLGTATNYAGESVETFIRRLFCCEHDEFEITEGILNDPIVIDYEYIYSYGSAIRDPRLGRSGYDLPYDAMVKINYELGETVIYLYKID